MHIRVITAFPGLIESYLSYSMFRKAREKGVVDFSVWDLRSFTFDKHNQVDDKPYGGGSGMVLKPEPFFRANAKLQQLSGLVNPEIILPTPQGEKLNHQKSIELSGNEELNFFCGHYKGIDERVREELVTSEISIGDYVLTGGELPALVIIDSVIRHVPEVINSYESAQSDSFTDDHLEGPVYTRPRNYQGLKVPDILLSGNHQKIAQWRNKKRYERTKNRRKDLIHNKSKNNTAEDKNG